MFSKKAYNEGVVLIKCDGCSSMHLIADNLDWFKGNHKNIEGMLLEKGQEVKKVHAEGLFSLAE